MPETQPTVPRSLTASELCEEQRRCLAELQNGAELTIYTDDGQRRLGVLTRDTTIQDAADIQTLIATDAIPPQRSRPRRRPTELLARATGRRR